MAGFEVWSGYFVRLVINCVSGREGGGGFLVGRVYGQVGVWFGGLLVGRVSGREGSGGLLVGGGRGGVLGKCVGTVRRRGILSKFAGCPSI